MVPSGTSVDLDRDRAIQGRVARTIHFTHAARAEGGEDFIRAEATAGADAHFLSPASQLVTIVIGGDPRVPLSACTITRNRCPSGEGW